MPVFVLIVSWLGLVMIALPAASWAAWQEPTANEAPPNYTGTGYCKVATTTPCSTSGQCTGVGDLCLPAEIQPLLNASTTAQRKVGTLMIGDAGVGSSLCLNADARGANDATHCITAWGQALASGGSFLLLSTPTGTGANYPGDYPNLDNGYIRLKADSSKGQSSSIHVEADSAATGSRALFGYDSGIGTSYAGYFSGKLRVENGTQTAEVCLNSTNPWDSSAQTGGCISSWSSLFFQSGAVGFINAQAGPTYSAQAGQSALDGLGMMGSMIAGSPVGLPLAFTCGDGMCTANAPDPGETALNCPTDCAAIGTPTLAVRTWDQSTYLDITPATQAPGGSLVTVVVFRRVEALPAFIPEQGVTFTTGDFLGNDSVAFAGQLSQGVLFTYQDTGLTNGVTYYYTLYQGNDYPRYANYTSPVSASGKPGVLRTLVVGKIGGLASIISGPGINCGADCNESYASGTQVTLTISSIQSGCTFFGWTGAGCSGTDDCTVTMNSNSSVFASFSCGGGGGGGGGPPPPPIGGGP